jgi:crotonobetainyl-CoA:carnitine CoA-transferase CaiB-like acyl-CoA transferase
MLAKGALQGIKVLDLTRMLPGPYCSMILSDHGAEVVAIEDRRFQQDGLFFNDLNRNKRHMTLNLKSGAGREIFAKMARSADVILEGFRPGVAGRLGVDYRTVREFNPAVVYCSISGFGQNGDWVNRAGHDVNYISTAGLLDLIGERGGPPTIPGIQIADIAGGSMNAALGIMFALFAREKSGEGQYIDISMTDGVLGFLSLPYFFSQQESAPPERGNVMLSHRYACYNTYETKDGRYLSIGGLEHRFWKNLCLHLGLEEFVGLQYDETRRQEITDTFRSVFLSRALEEWEAELGGLDVCYAAVRTMQEVLEDPLFKDREMVHSYQATDGMEKYGFGIPVKLSATPGSIRSKPCNFGEHTSEILRELAYSESEIEGFFNSGVV